MAQKKVKLPAGEAVQTPSNIANQLDRLAMRKRIIGSIDDMKDGRPTIGLRWDSPCADVLEQYSLHSDKEVLGILDRQIHYEITSRNTKIDDLKKQLAYTKKLLADMENARAEASNIRDELRSIIIDALNRPR